MELVMSRCPCSKVVTSRCSSMISRATAATGAGENNALPAAPAKKAVAINKIGFFSKSHPPSGRSGTPNGGSASLVRSSHRPAIRLSLSRLMGHDDMGTTIFLPALLGAFRAEGVLFAVASHIHARGWDAQRNQVLPGGLRATVTENNVVFRRTPLVAMTFDGYGNGGILLEEIGGLRQSRACIIANVCFIEIEVSILHLSHEQFLHRWLGRFWSLRLGRWGGRYVDSRNGFDIAAGTGGREGIRGRLGWLQFC